MMKTGTYKLLCLLMTVLLFVATSCSDDNMTPSDSQKTEEDNIVSIELDREVPESGMYFGDFWKEGYANYYFELADGELGMIETSGIIVPLNEDSYIIGFDIWSSISADHSAPVIPEGRYTANIGRKEGCFDLTHTLAVYNGGKVGDKSRIQEIKFSEGTVDIKHSDTGYSINAEFKTQEGNAYVFKYDGAVTLTDWSNDEEEKWEIGKDVSLEPVYITKALFEEEKCDNWILRCFDSKNISPDGLHVNQAGTKFQLSIRVPKGNDIAGTYGPGNSAGTFETGKRLGIFATGTYCERINPDMSISYCLIEKGEAKIEKKENGTYLFDINMKTADGFSVKGIWTCTVEDFRIPPQTTLEGDVVCNPIICSQILYYGDLYGNETSNYTVFFETETEVVAFDLLSSKTTGDDKMFPCGTFTISETTEAGAMFPGKIDNGAYPSCYVKYDIETKEAIETAPFASGQLTVTKSGDEYTFNYKVYDDFNNTDSTLKPNCISGTWTGKLPEFTYPEISLSRTSKNISF